MQYTVTTFYKFYDIPAGELKELQQTLLQKGEFFGLIGLILIAPEGINATIAGTPKAIQQYKDFLSSFHPDLNFKDSAASKAPFRRFKVKIKPEIVALQTPGIRPQDQSGQHLSPAQWDAMLAQEDVTVIDVRNRYETKLGMFKKALDPKTWTFNQFPKFVKKSGIPKDKPVLMYCTGGIRCEKAALLMEQEGYQNVYQLDGGILNYIQHKPNHNYQGECFVFDHRVAVTQDLTPTNQYGLCPHCGNAGEIELNCQNCQQITHTCQDCQNQGAPQTCSKNCTYHLNLKQTLA